MAAKTVCAILGVVALLAVPARAAPAALHYDGELAGITAFAADAVVDVQPDSYRVQLGWRLLGAAGFLFHSAAQAEAQGTFTGGGVAPREMVSTGRSRGQARVTRLGWADGRPSVMQLQPPLEADRERVPESALAGAIDGLSAMALLLHDAAATGRCDGQVHVFDGRRLTAMTVRTGGMEMLARNGRGGFAGPALRCDVESLVLAGRRQSGGEAAGEPGHASAWLARVGGALVPVRIAVRNRFFPDAVLYLAGPG